MVRVSYCKETQGDYQFQSWVEGRTSLLAFCEVLPLQVFRGNGSVTLSLGQPINMSYCHTVHGRHAPVSMVCLHSAASSGTLLVVNSSSCHKNFLLTASSLQFLLMKEIQQIFSRYKRHHFEPMNYNEVRYQYTLSQYYDQIAEILCLTRATLLQN